MNFEKIANYAPQFLEAGGLTLSIAVVGIFGALFFGLLIAWVREFQIPIISQVFRIYIELSRNTPLMIQLFFLYFALPQLGIMLSPRSCGIIGLIFLGGSYMAESYKSGFDAVNIGEIEAGLSLGMTRNNAFLQIILPIGIRLSFPSIAANIVFLVKETSVFSVVSLMDLTATAKDIIGMNYDTLEALSLLVISYLLILLPLTIVFSKVEKKLNYDPIH